MNVQRSVLLIAIALCIPFSVLAGVPVTLSYQALVEESGNPVQSNDMEVVFSVYDVSSGGTPLYIETDTVQVVEGVYSSSIGDNHAGGSETSLVEALVVAGADAWLGVSLAGEAELSPRERINSSPYAMVTRSDQALVGSVIMTARATPPDGYLECDGTPVSRTTFADLFAAIGTMYGAGDGSTTFNLPDCRGVFVRGYDHGAGTDPNAGTRTDRGDGTTGDAVGTKQADATARPNSAFTTSTTGSHVHQNCHAWADQSGQPNSIRATHYSNNGTWATWNMKAAGDHSHSITGGGDAETRPVNIAFMYVIKY